MHYYQHNIKDFNNATRHLTHVERVLYRDSIELYYDTEQALTSSLPVLFRRLRAVTDDEKAAVEYVLSEFFYLSEGEYRHDRCDSEIEKYHSNSSAKARAGKASADARRKKKEAASEQEVTHVEQVLNACTTDEQLTKNQEPLTINQLKDKDSVGKPTTRKQFKPPEAFEVQEYLASKSNSTIDANHFVDFYTARAWKLSSGTKMADWKAAVRTWISRENKNGANRPRSTSNQTQRKPTPAERVKARHAEIYGGDSTRETPDPYLVVSVL
jgi:uncharacterized protein YdaU (DUF1376 family)